MILAQNMAQFCAQFHTQNSKCQLNCTPEGGGDLALLEALAGEPLLPPHEAREGHVPEPDEGGHDAGAVPEDAPRPEVAVLAVLGRDSQEKKVIEKLIENFLDIYSTTAWPSPL